ncbi:putative bifunctional diguanylate cyclase/phosphodiesterase [Aquabacterium olei]|nr:EAL domain-containing protein [Aquabacterium olei]
MSPTLMAVEHDGLAHLAAWLLAVYLIYLQGQVVRRVQAADRDAALAWGLVGSLAAGTGIWAVSLLGLVAERLPIEVGYVPVLVLVSWLPAVTVSALTIALYARRAPRPWVRLVGGLVMAGGLAVVAATAVESRVLAPGVQWSPALVAASLSVTLFTGTVLAPSLRGMVRRALPLQADVVVALVLGTAFRFGQALMVSAAGVPEGARCLSVGQLSGATLLWLLPAVALVVCVLVHVAAVLDARAHRMREELRRHLDDASEALDQAVQRDALTGLYKRQAFEQRLAEMLEGPAAAIDPPAVLRIGLDGFRDLTERYGDAFGDLVLRQLAWRLGGLVREQDVVGRTDADEFLLLCRGWHDEVRLAHVAQRLVEAMRAPCQVDDQDIRLTCSVGVARHPASASVAQLMAHAADAMLTVRRAGGNAYCVYRHGMDLDGTDQVELQRELRHAIERGQLALHFQPKLRAADGMLAGVEALLRWQHPVHGAVSPAVFIPVAERFGLIGELGQWVLDAACRQVRLWHEAGADVPVAVNLSAHQLRQHDLEACVREALRRHRVPARMLILEITESVAMDDVDASIRVFDMLDAIGVQLSIDDFGTGYSSLSYLRRLPARQLKVDRSFVRDLDTSHDAQAIAGAVVRLAHALGMTVVAEGVETEAQAAILRDLDCDELQGFLYARPMSGPDLLNWLRQRDPGSVSRFAVHNEQADPAVPSAWSQLEMVN